jgi:hypothetical protein
MQKLNNLLAILFLLFPAKIFCQEFTHSAKLDKAPSTGFFTIRVTPELSRYLDLSLKDLRILDAEGRQVPYIIQNHFSRFNKDYFRTLPIVENASKDSITSLIIENTTGGLLSEIDLIVRNAATKRTVRISGSDDRKNWFIITENIHLQAGEALDNDRFHLRETFPKSSYKFIRFLVNNGNSDPLNIIEAGNSIVFINQGLTPFLNNPNPRIIQKDSADGYSYIKVTQPAPYHVMAVNLRIDGPKLFKRPMNIVIDGHSHAEFLMSTGSEPFYHFPAINDREFTIRIHNGDNPPLQISECSTHQEERRIVAYLKGEGDYTLTMGNKNAVAPSYDLQHFKDSIPADPAELSYGQIQENDQHARPKEQKSIYLWLIIVGVLAILSFFTWNLTRELKKRNN